jgi:hypothetical protein
MRVCVLHLLGGERHRKRPRTVQVFDIDESSGTLLINDKDHFVSVMLTPECISSLKLEHGTLLILKHTIVRIDDFHMSTTTSSANGRDTSMVSVPLTIQCGSVTHLGASGLDVIGDPIDLNKDQHVREALDKIDFMTLTARLAKGQFPDEYTLPDGGECRESCVATNFTNNNLALRIVRCPVMS